MLFQPGADRVRVERVETKSTKSGRWGAPGRRSASGATTDTSVVFEAFDDWCVGLRIDMREGEMAVGEVRIFPTRQLRDQALQRMSDAAFRAEGGATAALPASVPAGGLDAMSLKSLPFGRLIRQALADVSKFAHVAEELDLAPEGWGNQVENALPRPGPRGHPQRFFAEVAGEYLELIRQGDSRPNETLARRHTVAPSTGQGWIKTARREGLLTSAGRGRPGGRLTAKATALLEENDG
jgi:hypothetical protein